MNFGLLLAKDLKLQRKNAEDFLSLLMFSVSIMVLFHFSLPTKDLSRFAPGIFWITVFFSSVLALQRTKELEKKDEVGRAVLVSPVSRISVYLSKVASFFILLQVLQLLLMPLFLIFFENRLFDDFFSFYALSALISLGISSNGVLISGLTGEARFSEILVPILLFPILIPLFIAALEVSGEIFSGFGWSESSQWLKLILAYDLIFLTLGSVVFEFVTFD